jgi:hypothetical protein
MTKVHANIVLIGRGVPGHLGSRSIFANMVAAFSREELRMPVGLRRICCLLSVLALVGLGGCASSEPRDLAYETTYSAVGAQVR